MLQHLMRTLLLLRHAKSSWSGRAKSDHARPLATRGIKAALRMGHLISSEELVPDRVLCSTAKRARETLKLASELWPEQPTVRFVKDLYLASADELIEQIAERGGSADRLMVVGHNPDLHDLTLELVNRKPRETREVIGKFPTGALAVLSCDIKNWSELTKNCASLDAFIRPRDLE